MKNIVSIQFDHSRPKYRQLADSFAGRIEQGELLPGDRLPSIRSLATSLGVNPVTIVKAYERLEHQGLVTKRVGSGVYVDSRTREVIGTVDSEELVNDDIFKEDDLRMLKDGKIHIASGAINLATSTPDQELFPLEQMQQAITSVLERDKAEAFEYASSEGYRPLREVLADICRDHYGMETTADLVQIVSGAQQGIDITAKALLSPGDVVLTEEATYPGALEVFRSRGARVIGIRMEEDGPDMTFLTRALEYYRPRLLYLSACFQNPTGTLWSEAKRQEVLRLCREHESYIIEDDYISDLHFGSSWPKALKWFDRGQQERVIYIKSFSKIVMPGLRMAMLVPPEHLYKRILKAKQMTDIASSALIQRSMSLYLESGYWKEHIERIRGLYARRLEVALKELHHYLPWARVSPEPAGGVHLRVWLPEGVNDTVLYRYAAAAGVLITPGSLFLVSERAPCGWIRISTAASDEQSIREGIRRLALAVIPLWQNPQQGGTLPLI